MTSGDELGQSDRNELGLVASQPLSPSERAELDFLRYEAGHLQRRMREVEVALRAAEQERDTIRHERNLMSQDFRWTLERLDASPLGVALRRTPGFRRLIATWGEPPK